MNESGVKEAPESGVKEAPSQKEAIHLISLNISSGFYAPCLKGIC
jgi:hypothetical protein